MADLVPGMNPISTAMAAPVSDGAQDVQDPAVATPGGAPTPASDTLTVAPDQASAPPPPSPVSQQQPEPAPISPTAEVTPDEVAAAATRSQAPPGSPAQGLPPGTIDATRWAGFGYKFGQQDPVQGMVIHHTGGDGDIGGVIQTYKDRQFPAQFVIDRQGKTYQTLPDGAVGHHILDSYQLDPDGQAIPTGRTNQNMEGVEIIAKNDGDVLPIQQQAAARLVAARADRWGYDPQSNVFGHGELNPGHKEPDEGMSTVSRIRSGELPVGPEQNEADAFGRMPPVNGKAAVAQQIYGTLKERYGWTDAAIHGAIANGLDESNLNNATPGAAGEQGIFQFNPNGHLPAYMDYAKSNGLNPASPAAQAAYVGQWVDQHMPGYGQLTNPRQATNAFMTGFEAPKDQTPGRRFPMIAEAQELTAPSIRYAQASGGSFSDVPPGTGISPGTGTASNAPPNAGAPIPDLGRMQNLHAAIQESGARDDPRFAPADSPTSTAPPQGTTAYYQEMAAKMRDDQTSPLAPYGVPAEGASVFQQISHMASYLTPAWMSGFAKFIDAPISLVNGMMRYSASHPLNVSQDPTAGEAAVDKMFGGSPTGQVFDGHLVSGLPSQAQQAGAQPFTPQQLPGEGAAQRALPAVGKALGVDTRSPRERGDMSTGAEAAWDIGESLGMSGPFQFVGAGRALATTGIKAGLTRLGIDAGVNAIFPGMGEMLGNELVGPDAAPVGQIIGGVIGAKMAALRSGFNALVVSPLETAATTGGKSIWGSALNAFGPKAIAGGAADDFAGALARVQALRDTAGTTSSASGLGGETGQTIAGGSGKAADLVPGFVTPAYALSGDPGLRTLGHYLYQNDPEAFKTIRGVVDNDMNAVKTAVGIDTSHIDTSKTAIEDYSRIRDLTTQQSLAAAQQRAITDTDAATAGLPASVSAKANASAAAMDQLLAVDRDRRTLANADFAAARDSGAMNATVGAPNTTYNTAMNLLSEYQRLHIEGSIPQAATDLLFGAGSNPAAAFDRAGNRLAVGADGAPITLQHQYGPATTLEQQQALVSQLGNLQANEAALLRTGAAGSDPQKLRFLGQLGDAARQDFEAGLNASGNPAIVRNALNSWDEYRSTFRQGIIGRVLGFDASGAPRVSPEAAMDAVLRSGTQGVANTRSLLATFGQSDPVTGIMRNPATALRDGMLNYLRQDFANASALGQRGMEAWAKNHEAILMGLPGPAGAPFRQLSHDVNQAISSGQAAITAAKAPGISADDAVSLFLKGNPGGELDKALLGANRGKAMDGLVAATAADPTGLATKGLSGMVMDRIFSAGAKPNPAGGWDLNPGAARQWFETNKDGVVALDAQLPGFSGRAEQVVNSLERVAQIQANPGKPLDAGNIQNFASMNGIGRLAFRMIGASVGEKLGNLLPGGMGGRLQHAMIGSQAGMQLYDATFAKLSRGAAAATLREAMVDPEAFAKLSADWNTPQAAQQAAGALGTILDRVPRPYLIAGAVGQVPSSQNSPSPTQPPSTGPNPQQLGMPPASTALPSPGGRQTTADLPLPGQPPGPRLVPGGGAFQPQPMAP